jgi:hypothetical protein
VFSSGRFAVVFATRPSELCSELGATAGGFARVVAAVVPAAALLAAALTGAALFAATLTGAALFAATGLTAATIAVAAFAAAALLAAAAVVAGIVATAARSSGGAGRLGTAARSGRSRTGRSGTARLAARRLAAAAGPQPIAQALPAALIFAARRSGIAATVMAGLDLGSGQQQQAEHHRETTNTTLHGRNSSQTSNTTEG